MARILALEPYYGGSHQAFLDGWTQHSRHTFTLLPLKAHHWKWRMRHAAITLAEQTRALLQTHTFDIVWCSSMCNVAELLGLCPLALRQLPSVVYFHENQLAYPSQRTDPRDVHFAFTNWATALAATQVWFNSAHNRDSLVAGLTDVFRHLPDNRDAFDAAPILKKSKVLAPGINDVGLVQPALAVRTGTPLKLVWAARFEHDKGPELLLQALQQLKHEGVPFELTVMGQQFASCPAALTQIEREFAAQLQHFGFEPNRQRYLARLAAADVFISTAHHEFFGLAVLEAAQAGCSLVLPNRLSYPELFSPNQHADAPLFYDGTAHDLVLQLKRLADMAVRPQYQSVAARYAWPHAASALDAGVDAVLG